ncbi:hypothetical protein [Streptomyces xanthophaeus]
MAARKTARKAVPKQCETCGGKGETAETVRVGARKGRETANRQAALCTDCWGTGEAPTD